MKNDHDDGARGAKDLIAETIDGAEDVLDPLEDLVAKLTTNPGAAFTSEALEQLAALKKDDRAAFEALRARLKKAGCRVSTLDESNRPAKRGNRQRSEAG